MPVRTYTKKDFYLLVKEYGIDHALSRLNIDLIDDGQLRVMLRKYQNQVDDILFYLENDDPLLSYEEVV